MEQSYRTLVQHILGISDQDIEKAIYRPRKRTYRNFIKLWYDWQAVVPTKHKRIHALDHYNALFGWSNSQLQNYARTLSKEWLIRFRQNIVRIDAFRWDRNITAVYIDIREMLLILRELWYDITPNAQFYNNISMAEAKRMGIMDIYNKAPKRNIKYKNKEEWQETKSLEETPDPEATKLREGTMVTTKNIKRNLKSKLSVKNLTKKQGRKKSIEKDEPKAKTFRTLLRETWS